MDAVLSMMANPATLPPDQAVIMQGIIRGLQNGSEAEQAS